MELGGWRGGEGKGGSSTQLQVCLQVTVNCVERGLLLSRVRDELKLTIETYETLYESAIAYGLRKAIGVEQKKTDAERKFQELQQQNQQMSKRV